MPSVLTWPWIKGTRGNWWCSAMGKEARQELDQTTYPGRKGRKQPREHFIAWWFWTWRCRWWCALDTWSVSTAWPLQFSSSPFPLADVPYRFSSAVSSKQSYRKQSKDQDSRPRKWYHPSIAIYCTWEYSANILEDICVEIWHDPFQFFSNKPEALWFTLLCNCNNAYGSDEEK